MAIVATCLRHPFTIVGMYMGQPARIALIEVLWPVEGWHAEDVAGLLRQRDEAGIEIAFPVADSRQSLGIGESAFAELEGVIGDQGAERIGDA